MRSGWLGTGPKVARFENDFKAYKGAGHSVAVNSCTAALHLSILAAGIKPEMKLSQRP
jgi:dTDP-4-amino-4,6-dideoxygalactose transaminase